VLGLPGDGFGRDVAAVAVGVNAGDWLFVELGEEDVGDGVMNGFGCGFEEIGETDVEAPFAETDGGVERGEAAKADVEGRDGGAGSEFAVFVLEDGDEGGWRGRLCGAGSFRSGISLGRLESCWGFFVEERRGRSQRRRKELQELAQGRWAGMLRCGQSLVLVTALMSLLDQTPFSCFHQLPFSKAGVELWVRCWVSSWFEQ